MINPITPPPYWGMYSRPRKVDTLFGRRYYLVHTWSLQQHVADTAANPIPKRRPVAPGPPNFKVELGPDCCVGVGFVFFCCCRRRLNTKPHNIEIGGRGGSQPLPKETRGCRLRSNKYLAQGRCGLNITVHSGSQQGACLASQQ